MVLVSILAGGSTTYQDHQDYQAGSRSEGVARRLYRAKPKNEQVRSWVRYLIGDTPLPSGVDQASEIDGLDSRYIAITALNRILGYIDE